MKKKKKKKQAPKKDWVAAKHEISKTKDANCLRSKDVAHILDLSPDDVIELARNDKMKAHKIGRFWRFKLKDVMEYKEQKGG